MDDIIVTPENADVRGSTPVINTKELLLEMRADLKSVLRTTDVLASQRLDERLNSVEDWQNKAESEAHLNCITEVSKRVRAVENWQVKADGRMDTIVRGVPLASAILGLLAGIGAFMVFGGPPA